MADEARLPGEPTPAAGRIIPDEGRETVTPRVASTGDRPIQVGPPCHVFETGAPGSGAR